MDEDRPKYGSNPYPVQVRVNILNTFTLRHITTCLFSVSNLTYSLPPRTNQMQQGSSLPTQAMFHGQAQDVPSAFLLMLSDGKIHVFLQLAKYTARMGLPPTPGDDQLYAQKGELYHNQAQTVTDYFNQVRTQLRVATSNATPLTPLLQETQMRHSLDPLLTLTPIWNLSVIAVLVTCYPAMYRCS